MEIRKVSATDDFNLISRIYALSWKAAYIGIVPQQYLDELAEDYWTDKLQNSAYDSFVLIEEGKYIGTSSICAARDENMGGWGEIISIYLLPEYIGKGYGRPLFAYVFSELLNKGYKDIYLWVLEKNIRARRFYEKNGFSPADSQMFTIGNEEISEIRYIYHSS